MKHYYLSAAGATDVGILNKVNEDTFVYKLAYSKANCAGVFAVADGVGGLTHGDIASSIAISNINQWWENNYNELCINPEKCSQLLIETFQKTNKQLLYLSNSKSCKMATTLSVIVIFADRYFILHIGDSRIYKGNTKAFNLKQLSQDHSCLVQKQTNGTTYFKSVLTECLGNKENINPFLFSNKTHGGDVFLICSDGIYKKVPSEIILKILKTNYHDLNELCQCLISTAKRNGETDNITVVAVKVTNR